MTIISSIASKLKLYYVGFVSLLFAIIYVLNKRTKKLTDEIAASNEELKRSNKIRDLKHRQVESIKNAPKTKQELIDKLENNEQI